MKSVLNSNSIVARGKWKFSGLFIHKLLLSNHYILYFIQIYETEFNIICAYINM